MESEMNDEIKRITERMANFEKWHLGEENKLLVSQRDQRRIFTDVANHLDYGSHSTQISMNGFAPKKITINPEDIKLKDPDSTHFNAKKFPTVCEQKISYHYDDELQQENHSGPRPFLKRGQGLARFRMSHTDFKKPPDIYKKIKIKHPPPKQQCVPVSTKLRSKNPKKIPKTKNQNITVKVYETNKNISRKPEQSKPLPKAPVESLNIRSSAIASDWYNRYKDKSLAAHQNEDELGGLISRQVGDQNNENKSSMRTIQIPNSKDLFGIDTEQEDVRKNVCTSEQSAGPLKKVHLKTWESDSDWYNHNTIPKQSITEHTMRNGLQSVHNSDKEDTDKGISPLQDNIIKNLNLSRISEEPTMSPSMLEKIEEMKRDEKEIRVFEMLENCIGNDSINASIFSRLLNDNFQNSPSIDRSNHFEELKKISPSKEDYEDLGIIGRIDGEDNNKVSEDNESCDSGEQQHLMKVSERETIKRKSLQDNVKFALYSYSPVGKKKIIKKKKFKDKNSIKIKKKNKEEELVIANSGLIQAKLEELQIQKKIYEKNNCTALKMKHQLEAERLKFEKEKKDFEKKIQIEHEELQIKIDEEKKKLHKEKQIFEKYCKEFKNQPSRQEREEINHLKTELENLNKLLATKESRWGSSQAMLRSKIKSLTKENETLKAEVEKLKKQSVKKVTFTNGRSQLFDIVNERIDSLSSNFIPKKYNHKYQSLSARVDTNLPKKQLRKTKSAPNIKDNITGSTTSSADTMSQRSRVSSEHGSGSDRAETIVSSGEHCEPEDDKSTAKDEWNEDQLAAAVIESTHSYHASKMSELRQRIISTMTEDDHCQNYVYPDPSAPESNPNVWKEKRYSNGAVKKISPDGDIVKVSYANGDTKETCHKDGTTKHFYAKTKTFHTIYSDGSEYLEFENGQTERRNTDGSTDVKHPSGKIRHTDRSGLVEWRYPDKTIVRCNQNGDKLFLYPNGQREIHTKENQRREYPDGTVKILYPNGIQETRYGDGRVRLKDKNGIVIMDSKQI